MSWRGAAAVVGFQVVWIVCALGAARGSNVTGIAAALVFVVALPLLGQAWRGVLALSLAGALIGGTLESLFSASGIVSYAAVWPVAGLAPAWIVALWLAFATTLPATRALLGSRPLLKSAALGAVFGPLSYVAGEAFGALVVNPPRVLGLAVLAAVWAVLLPGFMALVPWLCRPR